MVLSHIFWPVQQRKWFSNICHIGTSNTTYFGVLFFTIADQTSYWTSKFDLKCKKFRKKEKKMLQKIVLNNEHIECFYYAIFQMVGVHIIWCDCENKAWMRDVMLRLKQHALLLFDFFTEL